MRLVFAFFFSFFCAVVAGHAVAQDMPSEGSTIKEKLVLGRSTFALPPGDWHVVATGTEDVLRGGITVIGKAVLAYLVQLDDKGVFIAGLFHRVPTATVTGISHWNDSLCDNRHTLFYDAYSGRQDFPECLQINHFVQFFANAPTASFGRKIWDWFQKNKVKLPVTVLLAFYRNHFSGDFVNVSASVNPDWFGQDQSVKTIWAESEWEPLTYDNDPKRKAFVENFKKWSYAMADNARATLRERKPKAAMLPSLEDLRVK